MSSTQPREDWASGPKYQDLPWAVVFLVHLGAVTLGGLYAWHSLTWGTFVAPGAEVPPVPLGLWRSCLFAIFLTVTAGTTLLMALRAFAAHFIWASNALQIGAALLAALAALGSGNGEAAVLPFVVAFFNALWLYAIYNRIPFASALLQGACSVVFQYKSIIGVGYTGVAVTAVYGILWLLCVLRFADDVPFLLLLGCGYWGWQVIQNVVHTVVCGVTATWYFMAHSMPPKPVKSAVQRTLTTSFGSVCLGSLVVTVVKVMQWVVGNMLESDSNFLVSCAEFLLRWVDTLVQYFNEYAYVQVAMYGKPFTQASRDTWRLLRDCGLTAVINDVLLSRSLTLTSVVCSIAIGVIAPLPFTTGDLYVAEALLSFFIATFLFSVLLQVIQSTVIAIFVCYAEQPKALETSNAALSDKLQAAVQQFRAQGYQPTDHLLAGQAHTSYTAQPHPSAPPPSAPFPASPNV